MVRFVFPSTRPVRPHKSPSVSLHADFKAKWEYLFEKWVLTFLHLSRWTSKWKVLGASMGSRGIKWLIKPVSFCIWSSEKEEKKWELLIPGNLYFFVFYRLELGSVLCWRVGRACAGNSYRLVCLPTSLVPLGKFLKYDKLVEPQEGGRQLHKTHTYFSALLTVVQPQAGRCQQPGSLFPNHTRPRMLSLNHELI